MNSRLQNLKFVASQQIKGHNYGKNVNMLMRFYGNKTSSHKTHNEQPLVIWVCQYRGVVLFRRHGDRLYLQENVPWVLYQTKGRGYQDVVSS